jgi:hypothetical protein
MMAEEKPTPAATRRGVRKPAWRRVGERRRDAIVVALFCLENGLVLWM